MQLNSRFFMILSFIVIVIFLMLFTQILTKGKIHKPHKYIFNIFGESCRNDQNGNNLFDKNGVDDDDDDDILWGNETIELFKDQLGLTLNDDGDENKRKNIKCRYGEYFISALPGPDDENFPEVLWQFFSMDALEQMTFQCDEEKRLSLKAVYTERMVLHLNQIFDGYE